MGYQSGWTLCFQRLELFANDALKLENPSVLSTFRGSAQEDPTGRKLLAMEKKQHTLPETNIAPENGWLEYYFPIGEPYFQGLPPRKWTNVDPEFRDHQLSGGMFC